jgi:hypothetical protein
VGNFGRKRTHPLLYYSAHCQKEEHEDECCAVGRRRVGNRVRNRTKGFEAPNPCTLHPQQGAPVNSAPSQSSVVSDLSSLTVSVQNSKIESENNQLKALLQDALSKLSDNQAKNFPLIQLLQSSAASAQVTPTGNKENLDSLGKENYKSVYEPYLAKKENLADLHTKLLEQLSKCRYSGSELGCSKLCGAIPALNPS